MEKIKKIGKYIELLTEKDKLLARVDPIAHRDLNSSNDGCVYM